MKLFNQFLFGALALGAANSASAAWITLQDGTSVSHSRPIFDRVNRVYKVNATISNNSDEDIVGPLRLLVDESNIPAVDPSGYTDDGIPYFELDIEQLKAGESATVAMAFELQRKQLQLSVSLQQDNPNVGIYAEAEGGQAAELIYLGSQFILTEGDPAYVSIAETATNPPENDDRVGELSITFPAPGSYEMYARLRVGPDGANDDSFFVPDALGSNAGWVTINNVSGYIAPGEPGYTPGELVTGGGSAATEVWKWMRSTAATYEVNEGDLIQTFRYAGREDGLDIDKFVFAPEGTTFSVEQLESGLPGSVVPPPPPFVPEGPPLAQGYDKFLGGVCCGRQRPNFEAYWNQVTPENAGKWGSVEATRDVYNWAELDEAYNLAKDNGYVYKHHVLIWGNQQPPWIRDLPASEQLVEIQEWFNALNQRYPDMDFIEVVNEFDNDPPNSANDGPGYIDALRLFDPQTTSELVATFLDRGLSSEEATQKAADYDWIINSFQMARDIFPATTELMINEYSVINTDSRTTKMIEVVNLLQDRGLIDAIGFQGHAFSTTGPSQTIRDNIDRLAEETGLDLYVTELDIDGPTDLTQLLEYQRLFPLFWEHPAIQGITMWGYLPGHWRENQGAILAYENGAEKPALVWLRSYMRGQAPQIDDPGLQQVEAGTAAGTVVVDLQSMTHDGVMHSPGDNVNWLLLGGSGADLFNLDAETGVLTVAGTMNSALHTLYIQVQEGQYTSMVLELQILIPGDSLPPTIIEYTFDSDAEGWRGDYGTAASVQYDATAQAAVLVPDWNANPNAQEYIKEISLTDFTDATLAYTVNVTQAQVDGGLTVQPYIQTGAPAYARIYGQAATLTVGSNIITFLPEDNGNMDIEIVERVGLQLNGPLSNGAADNVLLEEVTITIPVTAPPVSSIEYDFVDDVEGFRGDYNTDATVVHDSANQAAELLPDGTNSTHNYIKEISSTDYTDATITYTVTVTEAQVASGITVQGYVQTGDPNYARIYGSIETLSAGSNQFTFNPMDDGNGNIENISRIAFQINGSFSGAAGDTVLLENVTVDFN